MPYEQEISDLKSSGSNVKNIISNNLFNSIIYKDTIKENVIKGLNYLENSGFIKNVDSQKNDIYESLYCVDGSFVNLNTNGSEIISLRVGSAILDTQDLFNIERDKFGTPNPHHVAKLFQHPGNIFLDNIFPSKNSYIYDNSINKFLTMRESFEKSLSASFEDGLGKKIKNQFFLETYQEIGLTDKNNITDFHAIRNLLNGIREESVEFTTQNEVQKLMLMTENILSQYLLYQSANNKEKSLIVLDGRLQNQDIGMYIKSLNESKIQNENNMLIGVQKTGNLNLILSIIHMILQDNNISILPAIKNKYLKGESLFFILDKKFKEICGVPEGGIGTYGIDCFYISQAPHRKEFVFTLPIHVFSKGKFKGSARELFKGLGSVFEYTNTNLYFKEKGALLTNILAHQNVSLNSKYTSVLGNEIKEKDNTKKNIRGLKPLI